VLLNSIFFCILINACLDNHAKWFWVDLGFGLGMKGVFKVERKNAPKINFQDAVFKTCPQSGHPNVR
jgi:hypothetical protein